MLIDWFTVVAQVLNFLVLVLLLKHFLYRPILNAIDVREKRIASELADAASKKVEAQRERDEFQNKNKAFDDQRNALFGKVTDEAKAERERLLNEAQKAAQSLNERQQEALSAEADNLNQAISQRIQQEVFAIAQKALNDLAATSLEERIVEVFIHRLGEMDDNMKTTLAAAIVASPDSAVVRSAFDLMPAQQATIQSALNGAFAAKIPVQFGCAPELIGGIEFTAGGQKVAWTIVGYLASLKKSIDEVLTQQTKSAVAPQISAVAAAVAKSS
jgi:F-type H+-transporting ATPase subunit b